MDWQLTGVVFGLGVASLIYGWLQWSGVYKSWADPRRPDLGRFFGPQAALYLAFGATFLVMSIATLTRRPLLDWMILGGILPMAVFIIFLTMVRPKWANPKWYDAYVLSPVGKRRIDKFFRHHQRVAATIIMALGAVVVYVGVVSSSGADGTTGKMLGGLLIVVGAYRLVYRDRKRKR